MPIKHSYMLPCVYVYDAPSRDFRVFIASKLQFCWLHMRIIVSIFCKQTRFWVWEKGFLQNVQINCIQGEFPSAEHVISTSTSYSVSKVIYSCVFCSEINSVTWDILQGLWRYEFARIITKLPVYCTYIRTLYFWFYQF